MAKDYTVKVFDQFYNLDLVVNASEYEIVYSFFKEYSNDDTVAKSFTDTLFRVSNETQISVLDLLKTFQTTDKMKISLTMAYYLNSLSNKTVLYGVNQPLVPNNLVQRNIIYDSARATSINANFTRTPASGCAPLAVTFTDTSSGTINFWSWNFGDGNTSILQNPTHTYTLSNTYSVTLTVTGPSGTDNITKIVTVNEPPIANFNKTPSSGCSPLAVTFTDTSTGTITGWLWDFGDGNTSTSQNPVHTYTLGGLFTVSLTVSNGCGSNTHTSTVSVTEVPVSSFTASPTSGDAPLTVTFTDTSTGTITGWLWDFGDGNTSTSQNPVHTYTTANVYTVTLTVSNACGSNSSNNIITVTVAPPQCDPYFAYVKFLLHCDGTNGSTTFVDNSYYARTVVAYQNAQVTTTNPKFGSGSALLGSNWPVANDQIQVPQTLGDLQPYTQDFTYELWVKASPINSQGMFGGLWTQGGGAGSVFFFGSYLGDLVFYDGSTFICQATSPNLSTSWNHVAVTRQGTTFRIFVNGTLLTSGTSSVNLSSGGTGNTRTFDIGTFGGNTGLSGQVDDIRYTLGVARYTSNFTPPTAAFPDDGCTDFSIPAGITVPETFVGSNGFGLFYIPPPVNVPAVINAGNLAGLFYIPSALSVPMGPSSPGDPYYSNVSLLLHMDGTNGSTTFTDNSPSPKTVTANGDAQVNTSVVKYGTGSYVGDGSGDYLTATVPGGLGASDFTIEYWVYPLVVSGFVLNSRTSGTGADGIDLSVAAGVQTAFQQIIPDYSPLVPINTWTYIAIVRQGSTWYRFFNGTLYDTGTNANNFTGTDFKIGGSPHGNIGYTNGYIDDFRITVGVARYTSNFTPPTAPFPNY